MGIPGDSDKGVWLTFNEILTWVFWGNTFWHWHCRNTYVLYVVLGIVSDSGKGWDASENGESWGIMTAECWGFWEWGRLRDSESGEGWGILTVGKVGGFWQWRRLGFLTVEKVGGFWKWGRLGSFWQWEMLVGFWQSNMYLSEISCSACSTLSYIDWFNNFPLMWLHVRQNTNHA